MGLSEKSKVKSEKAKMIRSAPFLSHKMQQSEAKNRAAKSENFPPPKKVKGRCPFYRLSSRVASFCAGISDFSLFTFAFSLLITVISLTSCEYSFDPTLQNDRYHFSIYGTLDASADTQWVRIMPLRDSLFLTPKPIDAAVTLQHITTGKTVVLNDSLFQYGSNAYAWNFWTPEKLLPDETYRLVAERSDGQTSSAFATLPADFRVLEVNYSCGGFFANILVDLSVRIESVERLAAVEMVYHYRIGGQQTERIHRVYRHLQNKTELSDGSIQIALYYGSDLSDLANMIGVNFSQLSVIRAEVIIASAGPDWPDTEGLDFEEQALPDAVTNVENGVGFLAGIVSKTVPIDIDRCES